MRPSPGPISLFGERQQVNSPTTSIFLSALTHCAVIGLVALGIFLRPRIIVEPLPERLAVRRLDLHMPDPMIVHPKAGSLPYPGPRQPVDAPPAPAQASAHIAVARQVAQVTPAPQTLLQPKLSQHVLPEKIPVPTVVIWQEESKPVTTIVPPPPNKPVLSAVQPSVEPPNLEVNLDKLAVASSKLAKTQTILPSTTSPVVSLAPQAQPAPPQTTSKTNAPPTPATVVSLSDLRKEGVTVLPAANETASANSSGLLAPGHADDVARADHGDAKGNSLAGDKPDGSGAGPKGDAAKSGGKTDASAKTGNSGNNGKDVAVVGQPSISAANSVGTVERIGLPRDGQFGAVIVGSTLEESYPEAAELWSGRLAYTVYLHVGLSKSWILQYALPRAGDAATGGNAGHLAAPWPYTIIRPNLALGDLNADALMVRGTVNAGGHFEALAVAFPPRFPQAEFIIASLRQWEFRPATQGGLPTAVEVLIIIPEESE